MIFILKRHIVLASVYAGLSLFSCSPKLPNDVLAAYKALPDKIDYNIHDYIPFIQTFIEKNNIKSVCDLGCGSGKLIENIYDILNLKYYGYDCCSKVIL